MLLPHAAPARGKTKTLHPRITAADSSDTTLVLRGPSETRHVLIVDDDQAVLRSTGRVLKSRGYKTLAANSGTAAIQAFELRSTEIGCVILDLVMPNITGLETLRILRALAPDLPVILTSGKMTCEDVAEMLPSVEGFIAKPPDPERLLALVGRAMA